jgi:peroxiredoxin
LGQLSKIEDEIIELGYRILAISADRPEKMRETVEKHDLKYEVLSDSTTKAAQAFGLAFRVNEPTQKKLLEYGIDIEDASGLDHHILPVPAVFIVDTDGIVRFDYVNPDYKVRIDPDELLEAARKVRSAAGE